MVALLLGKRLEDVDEDVMDVIDGELGWWEEAQSY